MSPQSGYKTKQRELLLTYLKSVPGVHITAADVCRYCKEHDAAIGKATIYRQLERFVDEGIINKYVVDGNTAACFEYTGEDSHHEADVCFHCKCEKCGALIHLHCDELEEIGKHLLQEHRFNMDPKRTVFYGVCEKCMQS